MSSIYYATLFAACASAANITTSIWIPGAASANQTFLGSVVTQTGDNTIMSLSFADPPKSPDNEYYYSAPAMVTIGGTTRVAYMVSGSDTLASSNGPAVTIQLDCQRSSGGISAIPTCTQSTLGADQALSGVCAGLSVASLPDYCTASDAQTFDQTMTMSGELQYYINNFQLIITAGTEKLGASAAATPSGSSATATGVASGNGSSNGGVPAGSSSGTTNDFVGSGSGVVGGGAAASRTSAGGSGSAQQATGAATPMKSVAPALAGLGAAAAAFFL